MERIPLLNELGRIGVLEEGGCDVGVFLVREYPRNVRAVLEGIARETGYNPIVHFQVWVGGRDICIGGPPIEGRALVVRVGVPDVEKAIAWAAILYHRLGVPAIHMNLALLADACKKHGDLMGEYGVPCEVALPAGPWEDGAEVETPATGQGTAAEGEMATHIVTWVRQDGSIRRLADSTPAMDLGSAQLVAEECRRLALLVGDMSQAELREAMDLVPALRRTAVRELVRAAANAPDYRVEEAIRLLRDA